MRDLAQQIRERLDGWAPPDPWVTQFALGDRDVPTPDEVAAFAEELSAAIDAGMLEGPVCILPPTPRFYPGFEQMRAALLVVLDLHKPERVDYLDAGNTPRSRTHCSDCDPERLAQGWPCSTTKAIAAALGIAIHDSRIENADG